MELKDFINDFVGQFDDTDASEIHADTIFQELEEWSSLTLLSIIAFIRTTYNKTLTGKEIRSCKTVNDLFELVNSK